MNESDPVEPALTGNQIVLGSPAMNQANNDITLRYRRGPLVADYLRGGAGAVMSGLPLVLIDVHWIPGMILGTVLAVFSVFLLRTALRQFTIVTINDGGIEIGGPLGKSLSWSALSGLSLKYFSTKRDRSEGWMTLALQSSTAKMSLESALDDFEAVVTRAASAASANDVSLDDVTLANLAALGIDVPDGERSLGRDELKADGWDWDAVRRNTGD